MIDGYEKAANEVVPAARVVIAKQLKERYNLTEANIARILGVAQAAVSKYLNDEYSAVVDNASKKIDAATIDAHIGAIAKGSKPALKSCICSICNSMNSFGCKFSYVEGSVQGR